ncbi:MAG: hypothetical protein HOE14_05555, partial [Gemmatimonadales bacterium]|nr:hypothetical protein [Gemmatimonadales bacterium]
MDICSDNHAEIVFNSRETRCPCCEANSRINDAIELLNAIPSEIAYTLATDGNPG